MGQSRADMVMVVHDALYGIEIKSDADSYARLDRQVKDYNLYYDYDLVVVGTRHAAHIKEHVPEWWGIITVEQVGDQVDFICCGSRRVTHRWTGTVNRDFVAAGTGAYPGTERDACI